MLYFPDLLLTIYFHYTSTQNEGAQNETEVSSKIWFGREDK